MPFDDSKGRQEGVSCFWRGVKEREESVDALSRLDFKGDRYFGVETGESEDSEDGSFVEGKRKRGESEMVF